MSNQTLLTNHFQASASSVLDNQHLIPAIEEAAKSIFESFENGGKLLICGNGGSAADAQHLSSELLNRYHRDRRELPGIALTTDGSTLTSIGNDFDFNEVFSKQVRALANKNDVLLVISTSGNSENILKAVEVAHDKSVQCVALNGKDGGKLSKLLNEKDIDLCVSGTVTARIQEVHGLVIHCLCELIDHYILD